MENTTQQRWIYMDVCRFVAIFFVVVLHVAAAVWGGLSPNTYQWQVLNVFNSLSRFSMPLYIMVSGALLLSPSKQLTIKSLYRQYILPMVAAFLFWSTAYVLLLYFRENAFGSFAWAQFIDDVLRGDPYSHWFIFVIISLYIVIPILRAVARNLTVCRYFLILWAIFSLIIPAIRQIPFLFWGLPQGIRQGIEIFGNATDRIKPMLIVDYAGYFLLGYYIHEQTFTKKRTATFALLGLVGFGLTLGLSIFASLREGAPSEAFYGNVSINVCLMAVGVMVGIRYLMENRWLSDRLYKAILLLSGAAFGIFLVHDFLLTSVGRAGLNALSFTPLLSVPVLSVAAFAVSIVIVWLVKKIPVIGKYIV